MGIATHQLGGGGSRAIDGVPLHVRTCTPHFCNLEMAGPITHKFGGWSDISQRKGFHMSWMGCRCTCTRHFCILGMTGPTTPKFGTWMNIRQLGVSTYHCWGAAARAHTRTPFLYLSNGWTDQAAIWYVVRHLSSESLAQPKVGELLHMRSNGPLSVDRIRILRARSLVAHCG